MNQAQRPDGVLLNYAYRGYPYEEATMPAETAAAAVAANAARIVR